MREPAVPDVAAPTIPKVEVPGIEEPVVRPSAGAGQVTSRVQGLALRSGPGISFPEIMQADKGESLAKVRDTTVALNGKPWVVVRKQGRLAYVWSGFLSQP